MNSQVRPQGGVEARVAAPVAHVTIDSSSAPAASFPALIRAVGTRMPGDVRVVVILGHWALEDTDVVLDAPGPFDWLERPDIISIAALQGPITGPGLALALTCDVRIAAPDATFALPALTKGLLPSAGVASRIIDSVGYARAFELCILGTALAADQAQQLGLVTATAPTAGLEAATDRLVTGLLALSRSATIETKALLQAATHPRHRGSSEASARRRLGRERSGYAEG